MGCIQLFAVLFFMSKTGVNNVTDLAEICKEKKQLVYNPLPHWIFEMGKKVCKQKQQNKQITKSANETKTTKKS